MEKELEKLEKINNDNQMEMVRIEEKISNLEKEKELNEKTIKEMGIDIDEAAMVLETSEDKLNDLITEAKKTLGIE